MRKPYYRKDRGAWYVKTPKGKSQILLHQDEAEAFKRWQQMLDSEQLGSASTTFAALADSYLSHTKVSAEHRKRNGSYIADFCKHRGPYPAARIRPHDVTKWLASHKDWGASSQRAAIAAIKRVYNWAIEEGLIDRSPLVAVKLPRLTRRDTLIDDAQHIAMIEGASHGEKKTNSRRTAVFRQVLIALRHSGTRPGMVGTVTCENVTPDLSRWVIPKHKTVGKTGKPLTIYLSPCLQTLTRILLAQRKSGLLFLNARKQPWGRNAIRCRMKRLRKKLGLPAGIVAYAYRHTFTTNAILAGNDVATVAELIGHKDLKMISSVYGHLDQHAQHLQDAAAKAMRRKP